MLDFFCDLPHLVLISLDAKAILDIILRTATGTYDQLIVVIIWSSSCCFEHFSFHVYRRNTRPSSRWQYFFRQAPKILAQHLARIHCSKQQQQQQHWRQDLPTNTTNYRFPGEDLQPRQLWPAAILMAALLFARIDRGQMIQQQWSTSQ